MVIKSISKNCDIYFPKYWFINIEDIVDVPMIRFLDYSLILILLKTYFEFGNTIKQLFLSYRGFFFLGFLELMFSHWFKICCTWKMFHLNSLILFMNILFTIRVEFSTSKIRVLKLGEHFQSYFRETFIEWKLTGLFGIILIQL